MCSLRKTKSNKKKSGQTQPLKTTHRRLLMNNGEKMIEVIYTCAFVDTKALEQQLMEHGVERKKLQREIRDMHVTLEFRPEEVDESLFGTPVDIRVVGYGVNRENEGLLVEVSCAEKKVQELCEKVKVPHITLSVNKDGKPVNTRYVEFAPISSPFSIQGVYGAVRFRR